MADTSATPGSDDGSSGRLDRLRERYEGYKAKAFDRLEVERGRRPSVRVAFDFYRRDQAFAGSLLAGGLSVKLFLWFLPFALSFVALFGSLAERTAHGNVLVLVPNGDAYALAKGSDRFGPLRIEGDVFFPDNSDSYLGVVYNFGRRAHRTDFGAIYIKGNDSYLQVNPHRDFGVSRALYPEFRVALTGAAAIRTAQWQQFAVEVVENAAHFYVGGSSTPQLTFSGFERRSGAVGLQPRSIGGDVWIDNIRVIAIERLSYTGPPIPAVSPDRSDLLTEWTVAGPFTAAYDSLAQSPERHGRQWRPFETDDRGAVVSGRVVDYHGPNTVAYYRTRVRSEMDRRAELRLSTVDDLAIWLNGRLHSYVARGDAAWFDFLRNPSRKPQSIPLELKAGTNELVLRVRGGVYASGGFFAAVVKGT